MLGNKGVEYVKSLGLTISNSYRPSKEIGQSYLHLLHHTEVNDILIAASMLRYKMPGYSLERSMLERELACEPFNAMRNGDTYKAVPDLFLDFRQALDNSRQHRTPILVEHDRGTESEEVIRRKIHAYSAMITSGWYKQHFEVKSMTIAFTTFAGERRRDKLREWALRELQCQGRALTAGFLFTAQPQPPDPKHLWLNPCWYTPYMDDKPVAMLGVKP